MAILVKVPAKLEDRFNVCLRDWNSRMVVSNQWKIEEISGNDSYETGLKYYCDVHSKLCNSFFHWLDELEITMGIPIEFMYITSKKEAYLEAQEGCYANKWLKISR